MLAMMMTIHTGGSDRSGGVMLCYLET